MRSLFQHVFGRRPPIGEQQQQVGPPAPAPEVQGQEGGGYLLVRPVPWQRGGLNLRPTELANLARWCVFVFVLCVLGSMCWVGDGSSAMCVCVRAVF